MKKILIIEDDVFLGDVLNQKLANEGFSTLLARDGREGYEKIKSFKPDLILLDIILPNMNGYEILEAKQKDSGIAGIPVIIVSNSGQPVEINRALALGVKDYLVKAQFDPEEVLIKVRAELKEAEGHSDGAKSLKSLEGAINKKMNTINLEGKKVVWVEDDQFLNDIITRKLSMVKCTFFHASEGEEALKIINKEIPDIIMLDIILSGMDGFEILRRIKAEPKTKHIPVILLSNLGQKSDIEKGEKLGAARFIVKATITPNEIIDQIKEVLTGGKK
ncbi:MAG: Response regulator receiver protein [Candidatus Nomurabacteria bacterium GW2011_GWF2_40_31]|uniref:Response regulator receiver protein n=2 Tax=Candidatus Nomuraibacteriota TaxID=1752729 RepID=A0A837HUF4_9BACT|nr:MAG: Response regulator receiver protein [Candidatus Nomurabacteria bacterium GW2011_GWD2_39_12]KKR20566.1 MAG: Response regulator receiver protein [Candidatus Nomurabacteria bacterium GW2011_GWC2_39_41]KKR37505.1 MAG: Response regulator receiver protein [Candidatus Nomurabacteria bacterium GW2011_GWE2_40_10]KKR38753.1 MAG: Response regulator receiver protein [Candidatus Nomurabacteria bacterium GW2011_GWB1_40_11]KKR40478.1 MAG: Response regulator receiver protein [Parcubacteria group bacter